MSLFQGNTVSAVVLYKYIALPIRLLFCTSLSLLGSLLAARLSPATQTQEFFAVLGVFFCNKPFAISVADSHSAKGETAKASI